MREITVKQSTFKRLQVHAKPLVDTTDTVINRALDALELQESDSGEEECEVVTHRVDPQILPNLTHTTILEASLSQQSVKKPNWSKFFDNLLITAMGQVNDFSKIRKICSINMVQGRRRDAGYHYVAEIDISVQGMNANSTCRAIVDIAQDFNIGLKIIFMWRCKEGAIYPGEKGKLCLSG